MSSDPPTTTHTLIGLDAANPLGFLAALGTLRLLEDTSRAASGGPTARMSWKSAKNSYRPVLHLSQAMSPDDLVRHLHKSIVADFDREQRPIYCYKDLKGSVGVVKTHRTKFRDHAHRAAAKATPEERRTSDLLAAFASDAAYEWSKKVEAEVVMPTRFSFTEDKGGKKFLRDLMTMVQGLTTEHLEKTLFHGWRYDDPKPIFRWDPADRRMYARSATNPANEDIRTVRGANVLGFFALAALPAVPTPEGPINAGWRALRLNQRARKRECFYWPIWEHLLPYSVVQALMFDPNLADHNEDLRAPRGILAVFRSERYSDKQKNTYFLPAEVV